jgi:hypothetical protein
MVGGVKAMDSVNNAVSQYSFYNVITLLLRTESPET